MQVERHALGLITSQAESRKPLSLHLVPNLAPAGFDGPSFTLIGVHLLLIPFLLYVLLLLLIMLGSL